MDIRTMTMQKSNTEIFVSSAVSPEEEFADHATGALVGAAVADAMGWITEFMKSSDALTKHTGFRWLDRYVSWPKNTGGRFNTYIDQINEGDYSDDTQLSLCIARSIDPNGKLDPQYFMKVELPLWMQYARGAGSTITAAAKAATRKSAKWNGNYFTYRQGGMSLDYRQSGANGAAMRVLPIAIANVGDSLTVTNQTWVSSIITHGHPRAIVGALTIAEAYRQVLSGAELGGNRFFSRLTDVVEQITRPNTVEFQEWEERWDRDAIERFANVLSDTKTEMTQALAIASRSRDEDVSDILRKLGCFDRSTRGSGIATVAGALSIFYRFGGNYKACVEQSVNLIGTDTDTIGAMAGGLAGALGGTEVIPEEWAVKVQDFYYLNRVAECLARVGMRRANSWELGPQTTISGPIRDSAEMDKASRLARGQRISHPIFGAGWVRHIGTQEIRRKSGGTITLVDIEFDMGQTIRLRTRPQLLQVDKTQIDAARSRMKKTDGAIQRPLV